MSVALDLGTDRLKSLCATDDCLDGRSCRATYALLPDSPDQRRLLNQAGLPFAECEDQLLLICETAVEYAKLFQSPCLSLFPGGRLPRGNPPARQLLATLIEGLLPIPATPGEICSLTVPGAIERRGAGALDFDFLTRLVQLRGYRPLVIGAGQAIVLAELSAAAFTGIGLSFGANSLQLSVAHRGIEQIRCVVPRGGTWIDEQLARDEECFAWDAEGNRYLDLAPMREWKESESLSLSSPQTARARRCTELVGELLQELFADAGRLAGSSSEEVRAAQPVPLVFSGGMTLIDGFAELLERTCREMSFPLPISEFRPSSDPTYSVARGCVIHAELENVALAQRGA